MNSKRGFTLIELLTAIAIIGILIALISPALRMSRTRAKTLQCMNNLKEIANIIGLYEIDNARAPKTFEEIKSFALGNNLPEGIFECPLSQDSYAWNNDALDTPSPLIQHGSSHKHEADVFLTGHLNVFKGNINQPAPSSDGDESS